MEMLSKKWVLIMINAILVIGFGIILLLIPIEILTRFVFIIGIAIAFVGLLLVFGAFNYAKDNKNMILWMFQGIFNLVIGGIIMFFPEASIKFLLILAGLWAIVLGVYQFSVSFISNLEIQGKTWHKINGFAAILVGILLIFAPELFMEFMLQVFGFILLAIGGGLLYFSFLLKKLGKIAESKEEETLDLDAEIIDDKTTNP